MTQWIDTRPGCVYRCYSIEDTLLYIGVTVSPEHRFGQHRDEKWWWRDVAYISMDWFESRSEAEKAEEAAIWEERPLFNVKRVRQPEWRPEPGFRLAATVKLADSVDALWPLGEAG